MRHVDPFRAGPDVSAYIPRARFEQNCHYLAAKLEAEPTWVGIAGPAGVGKTLLLRLLMRRVAGAFTAVYVPSGSLSPAEVSRWVAAQIGLRGEPDAEVANRLARKGRPLLLAIDEAQYANPELVAWVERLCNSSCAARAVMVWSEAEGERVPAALACCPTRVFVEPLELADVPAYVEAQLARAGAPAEQRALLAGRTLERIALASNGNPRIIQRLADAEFGAHAWRTRVARAHQLAAALSRATVSAPRGATEIAPEARSHDATWRSCLLAAAAALALAAAALVLTR